MPPHLVKRRGVSWYLIDGRHRKSLKTANKGIAEYLLRQYILGKHGIGKNKTPTVKEYYEKWIETKREPLVRKSLVRSYRQHFTRYILDRFHGTPLNQLEIGSLLTFRSSLISERLSLKTARNIIEGSFRAMWRDAQSEYEDLKNPFERLKWPRTERAKPDPFTVEERDSILKYFREHESFYAPWVLTMFLTGMRPSEATALTWKDVNLEDGTISITRSTHLKATAATKTAHSRRVIGINDRVLEELKKLPILSDRAGGARVFLNKWGRPLDANAWAGEYWHRFLSGLEIRYRKFYATRHTFITEAIKAGENIKAVADYCGTSLRMIEENYCGRLELSHGSNTNAVDLSPLRQALDNGMRDRDHLPGVQGPGAHGRARVPEMQGGLEFDNGGRGEEDASKPAQSPEKPTETIETDMGRYPVPETPNNSEKPLTMLEWRKARKKA